MKLEDKDVRIVYLPPMTIAAAYASGEGCEGKAGDMITQAINTTMTGIPNDGNCPKHSLDKVLKKL